MHVILKPFIKIMIWACLFLGIAELAGVDVEELLNGLLENISGDESTETESGTATE